MTGDVLASVASSGASALASAFATDAWTAARAGFVKLFSRGDPEREHVAAKRLDESAAQVELATDARRSEVRETLTQMWQVRLGDLLEEHPDAVEQVRALVGEIQDALSGTQQHRAQAVGTGHAVTANTGGVNITNTGAINDVTLNAEWPGPRK